MDIRYLYAQGLNLSQIATRLNLDRKTVRKYLKPGATSEQRPRGYRSSKVAAFREYLKARLADFPELSAERLFEELQERGYQGSARTVRRYVAGIRPPRPERVYRPLETLPGEQAQVDWGHFGNIMHHGILRPLYAFVLVLSWSRVRYVEFTVSQDLSTFLGCLSRALAYVGGVPRQILFDNAKTVVKERVGDFVQFNPHLLSFAASYGFKPRACWVHDPESKGKVESAIKYVRRNFFYARSFHDLDELNAQAAQWMERVNSRVHGTTREVPFERLQAERPHLTPLPAEAPEIAVPVQRQVTKACLFSFQGNRYSAPYQLARQRVCVRVTEGQLRVYDGETLVATHERCWGKGQVLRQEGHYAGRPLSATSTGSRALQQRFESIGPAAGTYLQGLAGQHQGNLREQVLKILGLLEFYPAEAVNGAMARAIQFNAYGYGILKRILERQEREPASLPGVPSGPLPASCLNGVVPVEVETRDLASYAALLGVGS